jgi:hypothetical protein
VTSRRTFLRSLGAAGLALLLPKTADPKVEETDSYSIFLNNVHRHICDIVRQEGREVHRLEIAAPVNGFRQCRLHLVAGPSLLDRIVFVWDEPWEDD